MWLQAGYMWLQAGYMWLQAGCVWLQAGCSQDLLKNARYQRDGMVKVPSFAAPQLAP